MRSRRLPFARCTYTPVVVARTGDTGVASSCSWCGARPAPRRPIYDVMVEPDAGRRSGLDGHFCSWACAESYHDSRLND